jgi:glycosyltransferase involved in cell wall biosynthesis
MSHTPHTKYPIPNTKDNSRHQTLHIQHPTPDNNRKIRVAQVITRMDWGGSADILRILCTHLDPCVYDVCVIIGHTKYPTAKTSAFLKDLGGKVTVITQLKREINPFLDVWAFVKLYRLLRREKFDIVHTHTAKAGVLGRLAARAAGLKVIIHTPHGHNFYGYFGPALSKAIIIIERFVSRFTDKIIALTALEKEDFIAYKVADEHKVSLIYQGLELDAYTQPAVDKTHMKKSFNIRAEELVIGFIGRLEPIKGLDYFIDAAGIVAEKFNNLKFILVGEGSLRPHLTKKIEDKGFASRCIFTGWREDILEINSILDILVLPSLNEAVGIALIEAQAMGVPVIATHVGGIPEVVNDKSTGLLVSPADSRGLAQAMEYLIENTQKRSEMSAAAKAWVRGKFKAEDMADKISRLYKELVKPDVA